METSWEFSTRSKRNNYHISLWTDATCREEISSAGYSYTHYEDFRTREEAKDAWSACWEGGELNGTRLVYLILRGRRLGCAKTMSVVSPSRTNFVANKNSTSSVAQRMATSKPDREVFAARDVDIALAFLNERALQGHASFI